MLGAGCDGAAELIAGGCGIEELAAAWVEETGQTVV